MQISQVRRKQNRHRRVAFEPLEPRQMLAVVTQNDTFTIAAGRALNVDGLLTGRAGGELQQVEAFAAPGNVTQMEYSAPYQVLFLRNSGSAIHVVDVRTQSAVDTRLATWTFSDMDLTPDGRYLYAADYGGTNIGYGTPANPSYVHRFDLATFTWEIKAAPSIAYQVEAIDGRYLLLQEQNQSIDVTIEDFGAAPTDPMARVAQTGGSSGDFEFDHRTGRLYSGNTGSSSHEIQVREIVGNTFENRGSTGTYGTAQGYQGGSVLSSDGGRFYYGKLQVEAADPRNNLRVFPETIQAATPYLAFGATNYYDAETGAVKGNLGFPALATHVTDDGADVWVFQDAGDILHHYRPKPSQVGVLVNDQGQGALTATLSAPPLYGELTFRADGTFNYVRQPGILGPDTFTYIAQDSTGQIATGTVTIVVAPVLSTPTATNDNYDTVANTLFGVGVGTTYDLPELVPLGAFRAPGNADQLEYSPEHNLLFLRTSSRVRVVDVRTETEVSVQLGLKSLSDMDLTADGQFLYVADYGGTRVGYGTPSGPSYVHRFNLSTRTWESKTAPGIAYRVEAIDGSRFLLLEQDQSVDLMLNEFGDLPTAPIVQLQSRGGGTGGDIEFDSATGRLYHGNSGSSSQELSVRTISTSIGDGQGTGTYGTAQGYGGTMVLSSDGSRLYYGSLQVDASSITTNTNIFPEAIHAAAGKIAFGTRAYYDARTSDARGRLGYDATVMTVSSDGQHFWAFNPDGDLLNHYRIVPVTRTGVLINDRDADADALTAELATNAAHGNLSFYPDGTFLYTPAPGFSGIDSFTYLAKDSTGRQSTGQVTITVQPAPGANGAPQPVNDTYTTPVNQPLVIGVQPWRDVRSQDVLSFATIPNVLQIEHSPQFATVFVRTNTSVYIYNANTGALIGSRGAVNVFSDMDLTFDGRYLFAADYGAENVGYGTPVNPHYVHRYDLVTGRWDVQYMPRIAYRLEAVDRNHVLLQERDQHVAMTYNEFSDWPNAPMEELSRIGANYYGDFEYDPRTGRIIHGNSGSSSQEIHTRRLVNGMLQSATNTATYGSAQGHGGSSVLSSDGKYFFYGRLQVEALDVRNNLRVFPETIRAATGQIAFGDTAYYDIKTGQALGNVGFTSTVWFASDDGGHVWSFDSTGKLHHFLLDVGAAGVVLNDTDPNGDPLTVASAGQPTHGTLSIDPSGAFRYVPAPDYMGTDQFTYRVVDASGAAGYGTVNINVVGVNAPTDIQLAHTTVHERVLGFPIAQVVVVDSDPGDTHTFALSDNRFEVIDGVLRLKANVSLDAATASAINLSITATDGAGLSVTRSWQLTVEASAALWHNPSVASDVSGDFRVAPEDALLIINELNNGGARRLSLEGAAAFAVFFDTNADGVISPEDALIVINYLNAGSQLQGEGAIVTTLSPHASAAPEKAAPITASADDTTTLARFIEIDSPSAAAALPLDVTETEASFIALHSAGLMLLSDLLTKSEDEWTRYNSDDDTTLDDLFAMLAADTGGM